MGVMGNQNPARSPIPCTSRAFGLLVAAIFASLAACGGGGLDAELGGGSPTVDAGDRPADGSEEGEEERDQAVGELSELTFTSQLVTTADWPAKLAVAPDGRLFYSEYRSGNIRIIGAAGQLLEQPFAQIDVAKYALPGGQVFGLFGLAFDPDFEANHFDR